MQKSNSPRVILSGIVFSALAACGGGDSTTPTPSVPVAPPAPTYTVGGAITGLKSGGMILASGVDKLSVAPAATSFVLPTALTAGTAYNVVIADQPPRFTQVCALANGSGTIGNANVTNIGVSCSDQVAVVSTLAGTNNPTKLPTGLPEPVFDHPQGLTLDDAGNVFVADQNNARIAMVTPAGVVTTFVGRTPGEAPSDADLVLGKIEDITRDKDGNFYAVGQHMVFKITRAGVITTLAGAPSIGYADGTGTQARFNTPLGIKVDDVGNLYVADTLNLRIRKITPAGVVTTIAGSGVRGSVDGAALQASFANPIGIAVDHAGNVFVSESNLIRKLTPAGTVSTFAGSGSDVGEDGQGLKASFNHPYGLAIDAASNLYVAEQGGTVRTISPSGYVATVAGKNRVAGRVDTDGVGSVATFSTPHGIAVDAAGNLYIGDRMGGRVRKIVQR
ncbi:hypothetical protein GTP56_16845 [Duganella sp. FT134W]|uniref:NHL repeat-containing protein n=1 Tax=Duganella margarita TaxID=2692170 RepID=A0A7X4H200_9BURK|nr:hypothetical protein [Duganella margarita]MYM73860.1 hypothetical protein [Duganella margarita]